MSASAQTSSAWSRILAPAATYSSSGIEDPTPASFWTTTSCPSDTSSWTPTGVIATRYSWFLTSFGTPTFTRILLAHRPDLVVGRLLAVTLLARRGALAPGEDVVGEHGGDQRSVAHPALQHRREEVRHRHPVDAHLGLLVLRLEAATVGVVQPAGQVDHVGLRADPRRRQHRHQVAPAVGHQGGLLTELTPGGDHRVLPRYVEEPGRELDQPGPDRVPVLAQHDHLLVGVDGQDHHRAGQLDDEAFELLVRTLRCPQGVGAQRQHPVAAVEVRGPGYGPLHRHVAQVVHAGALSSRRRRAGG